MKNPILKTALSFFILIILFSSCRKFEEGGPVRKADDVLPKEWSRERGFKNGASVSQVQENPQIGEITENMIFNADGSYRSENGTVALSGTWKLTDRKKKVEITIISPSANASTISYDIVKLTDGSDGQLILEHTYNGSFYRYECRSSR